MARKPARGPHPRVGTFTLLYNLDVIARVVDILDFFVTPLVGRPRSTAHASEIR